MRGDLDRLLDILEAIERIQNYAAKGRVAFETDEMLQFLLRSHHAHLPKDQQSKFDKLEHVYYYIAISFRLYLHTGFFFVPIPAP